VNAGRWSRSALCGLLAVAQVVAFAHVALVAHRICAEHGESIHASPVVDSLAPTDLDEALASVSPSRGAAVGHDHDHCLCMVHSRERFVVPPRTSTGLVRVAIAHAWQGSPPLAPALSVALLLLAPKGSPPALL
jgi:hypothetical protein